MKRSILFTIMFLGCFAGLNLIFQKSEQQEHTEYRIAAIMPSSGDRFWKEMWQSIRTEAENENAALSEYSYERDNEQKNLVNELTKVILSKPDGIILCANQFEEEAVQQALKDAKEKGIPILLCDSDSEKELRDCFVGSDNTGAGKMAAQKALEMADDASEILLITGEEEQTSNASKERIQSLKKELQTKDNEKKITWLILKEEENDHYEQLAASLDTDKQEKKIVVCFNASSTIEVAKCMQHLGVKDTYKLIGFGESDEAVEYTEKGMIDLLLTQDIEQLGEIAVQRLLQTVRKEAGSDITLVEMNLYPGND